MCVESFCSSINKKIKTDYFISRDSNQIALIINNTKSQDSTEKTIIYPKPYIHQFIFQIKFRNTYTLVSSIIDSNIGEPLYKDSKDKNLIIEKIAYNKESKELFINKSLYFSNIESSVFEYKIGGYIVLEKYLKSHKNEEIDFNHFQIIIQTLHKSIDIESKIRGIDISI